MCVVNSFKSLVHFGVSNSSRVSLFFSTNTQKAHTGFSGSTLSETTLHWRPTLKSLSSFNFLHTLLNASTICGGGHLTSSTPAPQHIGSLGHPPWPSVRRSRYPQSRSPAVSFSTNLSHGDARGRSWCRGVRSTRGLPSAGDC